jgi:hypothetical protein
MVKTNFKPVQDELHFSYKVADSRELKVEQAQKLSAVPHLLQGQPFHVSDQVFQYGR